MQTKSAKVLPKIADEITNGGLYRQRVRCGKANCKCAGGDGGQTHTAFYFYTRRRGKLVKFYVRRRELNAFAALIAQSAGQRNERRQAAKRANAALRTMRRRLSENDGVCKALTNK